MRRPARPEEIEERPSQSSGFRVNPLHSGGCSRYGEALLRKGGVGGETAYALKRDIRCVRDRGKVKYVLYSRFERCALGLGQWIGRIEA